MTESRGERATGIPNTTYDLSSVLFHALKGGASYDRYVRDAEEAGDEELADFFRRVRDEDGMRADEARLLLAERTPTAARTEEAMPATSPGPEPPGGFSGTQPVAEELPSGDLLGETTSAGRPQEDLARFGEAQSPGEVGSGAQGAPPPRTEPISAPPGPRDVPPRRTEEAPPSRTEEVPMAEEVPSGVPPQAPPGDVQRETSSEPPPRLEEERASREESEEDKGLVDKARDYLRGEGRERDYLRGE